MHLKNTFMLFWQGEGKSNPFEIQPKYSLYQRHILQEKGFARALLDLGKRQLPNSNVLSFLKRKARKYL